MALAKYIHLPYLRNVCLMTYIDSLINKLYGFIIFSLDLYINDTALKISQSLYCFTTSISRGDENYFPRLWDTGISDAIFLGCIHV